MILLLLLVRRKVNLAVLLMFPSVSITQTDGRTPAKRKRNEQMPKLQFSCPLTHSSLNASKHYFFQKKLARLSSRPSPSRRVQTNEAIDVDRSFCFFARSQRNETQRNAPR
jgi:hypothetical protein